MRNDNKKLRLLVIDDNECKILKVEEGAKILGMEIIAFQVLELAVKFLQEENVDGIITDMDFPIYEGKKTLCEPLAGRMLLDWLTEEGKEIPVLVNSTTFSSIKTDYKYCYEENMPGFFRMDIFERFVSSIKARQ